MDPTQLELIKKLIEQAEANQKPHACSTAPSGSADDTTSIAKTLSDDVSDTTKHTATTTGLEEPKGDDKRLDESTVPVPTPCRTDIVTPAVPTTEQPEAAQPEPSEKLKEFWSKFKSPLPKPTPEASMIPAPAPKPTEPVPEAATPTPSCPAAPSTTPVDEPMPPADTQAQPAEPAVPETTPSPATGATPVPLSQRERIRIRFQKMDSKDFTAAIYKAREHHLFKDYHPTAVKAENEVEDMVNWTIWLEAELDKLNRLPTLQYGSTDEAVKPTEPASKSVPDAVQSVLLRATTADLAEQRTETKQQLFPASTPAEVPAPVPTQATTAAQHAVQTAATADPAEAEKAEAAQKKIDAAKKIRAIKGQFHRSIRSS